MLTESLVYVMTTPRRDPVLYPNDDGGRRRGGVSRRRLLAGSVAAGVTATAGCSGRAGDDERTQPTVLVFNTGDSTVSVIDPATDTVVTTQHLGLTSSFPSNQYTPTLTDSADDTLWLNVGRGVRGLRAGSLDERVSFETGSGANWQEQTPDGRHLVVSAREPAHRQFRLDADPASDSFGEVTGELDRRSEGGVGADGPGPCDVTVHPEGDYAYVPDLFGDTLTVVDVDSFEIVTQVAVEPVVGERARPWMATVAPDGETLLVEHNEERGTESVWDLSDPAAPEQRARLTVDDGLGERPLTSEIGPGSETGYVFTPGTDDVTVVDLVAGTVRERLDLGGSAFVGTWDPAHEKLYVPVQTNDEVAVVDHASGEITATIPVGVRPYGATAANVRPRFETTNDLVTALATMGVLFDEVETTYCIGNCACGHEL
jgi:YVTN family beta-propeller protein